MLEVVQLHAGYGRMAVLHGISLTVNAGEIVSLIGSNGAGKSTTLRTISGLVALRDGEIRFKGTALRNRPAEVVQSGISQVPEGRRLFSDMTVHENLLLGAYLRSARASGTPRASLRSVSPRARTFPPTCRFAQRRRAADGRHRSRADGKASASDAG